jgi:hypothetical protein
VRWLTKASTCRPRTSIKPGARPGPNFRTGISNGRLGCRYPRAGLIELTYLVEKGRLPAAARTRVTSLIDVPESGLVLAAIERGVVGAVARVDRDSVPDMPDRIIARQKDPRGGDRDHLVTAAG